VEEVVYGSEGGLILVDHLEGLVDSVIHCLVGVAEYVGSSGNVLVEYVDRFSKVGGGRRCEMGAVSVGVESFDTCWDRGRVFGDVGDSVGGGGSGMFLLADGVLNGVLGIAGVQVVRGQGIDGVFLVVGGSWGGVGGVVCDGSRGVCMGRHVVIARVVADISAHVDTHFIIRCILCSMQLHVSASFAHGHLHRWFIGGERLFLDNGGMGRHRNFGIGCLCGCDKGSAGKLMVFGCCGGGGIDD
jgi:hypothetical protein